MTLGIAGKAFAIWLCILVVAIANGILREAVLIPTLGTMPSLLLSGILLSGLILAVSYLALPWFGKWPPARYLSIGFGWLLLTLIFEFAFGHLIQGKSWVQLLDAYTFKDGNIWPIVLLITVVAPYIAARMRGLT